MSDYCISNIHAKPVRATVHGIYVSGGDVWYCDECAETGVALRLFTPTHVLRKVNANPYRSGT